MREIPAAETLAGLCRKEKRKAVKRLKRKQLRKETALKEREEEEARANDPEEQLRMRVREQEEAERLERERNEFDERERLWIEAAKKRAEEEEARKALEESERKQIDHDNNGAEENDSWEYVEDGPAEIIWKGNEIIVRKKRIKVPKRNSSQGKIQEDVDKPKFNPLPPQSAAFADHKKMESLPLQTIESVAQQIPNFGTEQDKAHCPFHLKTGTCRFGTRCSRVHFYPDKSCTLLVKNMYNGPGLAWEQDEGLEYTDEEMERSYEEFYEDVHTEFLKFGEIVNFKVCRNGSSHLRGNVYVHYRSLDSAILAYNSINGRYFGGKQITCEFVGVTRWKVAICGEYMKSRHKTCSRGSACNFIHCFCNPGGDYEWADWDSQPPRYWIKKMEALFGPSPYWEELQYDKHSELQRSSSRKTSNETSVTCRYHSSRSKSRDAARWSNESDADFERKRGSTPSRDGAGYDKRRERLNHSRSRIMSTVNGSRTSRFKSHEAAQWSDDSDEGYEIKQGSTPSRDETEYDTRERRRHSSTRRMSSVKESKSHETDRWSDQWSNESDGDYEEKMGPTPSRDVAGYDKRREGQKHSSSKRISWAKGHHSCRSESHESDQCSDGSGEHSDKSAVNQEEERHRKHRELQKHSRRKTSRSTSHHSRRSLSSEAKAREGDSSEDNERSPSSLSEEVGYQKNRELRKYSSKRKSSRHGRAHTKHARSSWDCGQDGDSDGNEGPSHSNRRSPLEEGYSDHKRHKHSRKHISVDGGHEH
ncbi:hypothetical protein AMTRI_Chr11g101910 [Amborella trichopoda]